MADLIPKERYTSREFVDLEMDRLWPRVWQVACREEEVPRPGDFVEYVIGDQSILVMPANWKAVVDAFNEGYHVQGAHPQILPWTDDVSIAYEQYDRHARYGRLENARRELRPSPRLSIDDGEVDEGEILASLVAGLGGAFLKDERAIVEELRGAGLPPGSLLAAYQER